MSFNRQSSGSTTDSTKSIALKPYKSMLEKFNNFEKKLERPLIVPVNNEKDDSSETTKRFKVYLNFTCMK